MTDQVIRSVLEVDASKAVAGFQQGEKAVQGYERAVERAGRGDGLTRLNNSIRDNRAEWDMLSSRALVGGAALATGMGFATKAAIDWESAWAGVVKTTEGTDAQMAELEEGLRGLTQVLPATHEEIAGVAEAAGQLGVAREDVLGFTETAIGLGESTNLSAETAAESLAKFSNVMGTASREGVQGYERMGSALVALGNDGASTEADIMAMSLRLAGAGKMIGATEADILAMSNALSSVGIEAELGGGAMSRALLKMNTAVIAGGDELEKFADIAGMSATEFATAWRDDPIAATNAFVTGLGQISESGGDAAAALDEVGLGGTQNAQVLLRAAGASDLLTESLALGAEAWKDNTALQKEASTRYETTASKLQIARNSAKNAAIDFGSVLAPALEAAATKAAGFADAFVKLPRPVQQAAAGLTGITTTALLFGGAAVKVVGWSQDIGDALGRISSSGPRAEVALGGVSRSAKIAAGSLAILAAARTAADALQSDERNVGPEQLARDSLAAADAVDTLNDALAKNAIRANEADSQVRTLDEAMKVTFDPSLMDSFAKGNAAVWDKLPFVDITTSTKEAGEAFSLMDDELTGLIQKGNLDGAQRLFGLYAQQAVAAGYSTDDLLDVLPKYKEEAAGAANQAEVLGEKTAGMGDDMQQAEQDANELRDAIRNLGDTLLQQEASQDGYEASIDAMTASIKENGRTLDENTEKGRANRSALRDLANSTQEWAAAEFTATGNVKATQKILDEGRAAWIRHRDALGANKKETRELADALFSIDGLEPTANVKANTEEADKKARDFKNLITGMDGDKAEVTVAEQGATDARDKVLGLRDSIFGLEGKDVPVTESGANPSKSRVMGLDDEIQLLNGKTVTVKEEGATPSTGRLGVMKQAIAVIDGKTVTVTEVGSTAAGNRVVTFKGKIYEVPPTRSTTFTANTSAATGAISRLQSLINGMSGRSLTIDTTHRTFYKTSGTPMGTQRAKWAGGITGVQPMADGGMIGGGKQLPGGALSPGIYPTSDAGIWMAEDKRSKWEGYLAERMDIRPRTERVFEEIGDRLGYRVEKMADGGTRDRQFTPARHYTPTLRPTIVHVPAAAGAARPSGPVRMTLVDRDGLLLGTIDGRIDAHNDQARLVARLGG